MTLLVTLPVGIKIMSWTLFSLYILLSYVNFDLFYDVVKYRIVMFLHLEYLEQVSFEDDTIF